MNRLPYRMAISSIAADHILVGRFICAEASLRLNRLPDRPVQTLNGVRRVNQPPNTGRKRKERNHSIPGAFPHIRDARIPLAEFTFFTTTSCPPASPRSTTAVTASATRRTASVSGRVNVNRFGHLKVNIRTCKSEQKSEHFSCVRTARSVAIKGRRPSALRAFTPPLAAVEARGAGEPGPFELRLCGPFPCRKVVAA